MKYEDALKSIEGAQSVGGELIVLRGSTHIVVGKGVQGELIVADTDEARAVMAEKPSEKPPAEGVAPGEPPPGTEPAGTTHNVEQHETVGLADSHGSKPKK